MKQLVLIMFVTLPALGTLLAVPEEQQKAEWQKVYDAINKRLPQTAIRELEPIAKAALEAKKYDEAAKAIALKITMEGSIQGNKPEERITRLQALMDELPEEIQSPMEVILAHWYWQYFQQNRWRFMQRTQTEQPAGDDITSWDLSRILAEVDTHYSAALQREEILKQTPIGQFDALLTKGTMADNGRPTLFDFVAYEALEFYAAGEQAGAKAQDAYVLLASSPIFAPVQEFLEWNIESPDTDSPLLKAIRLYQSLLAFHQDDQDPTALADADLSRLIFGFNHAFGEERTGTLQSCPGPILEALGEPPRVVPGAGGVARVLQDEENLVDAHQFAQQGWKSFPDSVGGKLCFNLLQEIEAKEINVSVERVWNNPWPAIHVQYRNLTKVHFRAVPMDWEEMVGRDNYAPNRSDRIFVAELLSKKPALAWSRDLPATEDYLRANQSFQVPDNLKPGFYFLLASPREDFGEQDNTVLAADFWVSPLALVLRSGENTGAVEGFVLDADTGEPVANAQVQAWFRQRSGRVSRWLARPATRCDKNGMFRIAGAAGQTYLVLARHNDWKLATGNQQYAYAGQQTIKPYEQTVFFTDRSIYRPGQTIRFKGICVSVDQQRDNYKTLQGKDDHDRLRRCQPPGDREATLPHQ